MVKKMRKRSFIPTPPQELQIMHLDLHVFKKKAEAAALLNACLGHNFSQDLKKNAAHMG